jgi:hypothetical protein
MKHSRTAAGLAAAALATGLVLAGSATAAQGAAPRRISTPQELNDSLRRAVALERVSGTAPLAPQARGVVTAARPLPC